MYEFIIPNNYYSIQDFFNFQKIEYFLKLLQNSDFIIGNSSAGIREAPYYNIPTIDIGTRQNNRDKFDSIHNCSYSKKSILEHINLTKDNKTINKIYKSNFGDGNSNILFKKLLKTKEFWNTPRQKYFNEL